MHADRTPPADRGVWRELVAGVLARTGRPGLDGTGAEQALATAVGDGIVVAPLYTAEDRAPDPGLPGRPPFVRGTRPQGAVLGGWDVRQRHDDPDPSAGNAAVLADLEHGVTSLWLRLGGPGPDLDLLPALLAGVRLDVAGIVLDAGERFTEAAGRLAALRAEQDVPDDLATGNLGADPLGLLARTGREADTARLLTEAAALAATCARSLPGIRALTVDALAYHEAGASAAEELGCALGTALAYLRELTSAGLPLPVAAGQLEFRLAADTDQFLSIAKLRAGRRLWCRILEACGDASAAAAPQHAVTSAVAAAQRDPWVNMLRSTVAALAAGVGGAQAVTVLPFDDALGLPDGLARRIARNTQAILLEESHLGRVVDPAGGSWYVERLTDDLARAAWTWFQRIERSGGQRAALGSGLIAGRIAETWATREQALARRREPVTGVSEFPNLDEQPLQRPAHPAGPSGGLPRVRRAAAFESLRARSDKRLTETGARPRIALIALGPEAVHSARAAFAANLFQAGGIEPVPVNIGVSPALDAPALAEALRGSGAPVACLCSSDAFYAEHAEAAARGAKAAGVRRLWLAGRPGDREPDYRAAGIDEFVYTGCDALAALHAAFDENGAGR